MRYYKKLLTTFASISIVYTILITSILLVNYYWKQKEDFEWNANISAERSVEYMERQLLSVQEMSQLLRISEYTRKYLNDTKEQPDRYARLRLYGFAKGIFGANRSQKRLLGITKISDNYVIMQDTTGDLNYLQKELHLNNNDIERMENAFTDQAYLPFFLLKSQTEEGESLYTIVKKDWVGSIAPLYLFVAYNEKQFFPVQELENASLVLLYQGETIAFSGSFSETDITAFLQEEEHSFLYSKRAASAVHGFSYLYLKKEPSFFNRTTFFIIALGVTALGASILFMLFLTKRIYHPINEVMSATGGDFDSGDEMAYLQSTLRSFRDHMDEMTFSLKNYSEEAEKKFFRDLLVGLLSPEESEKGLEKYSIPLETGPFVVAVIEIAEDIDAKQEFSQAIFRNTRELLFSALLTSKGFYRSIDSSYNIQGVLFQGDNISAVTDSLRNAVISAEPEQGLEITAFIGGVSKSIVDICTPYRSAMRMMEGTSFRPQKTKVIRSEEDVVAKKTPYYPLQLEQKLISSVMTGRTELWEAVVREIITENLTLDDTSHLALMFTVTIKRILDAIHQSADTFLGEDGGLYLEFRECKKIPQIGEKLHHLLSIITKHILEEKRNSEADLAKTMTSFLEENYAQNISLYSLADHLNMSRNYVSTLFKNTTGENFRDYLAKYRYDKAVFLIKENPKVKIRDVAKKVCCNPDALSRLFIRYAGMTPSEYQRSLE